MFTMRPIVTFFVMFIVLVFSRDNQAADYPGPRLIVTVYADNGQIPIHGARVSLSDGRRLNDEHWTEVVFTQRNGSAKFHPLHFRHWTIGEGKSYDGSDPWDWEATPSRISGAAEGSVAGRNDKRTTSTAPTHALFNIRVAVSADGYLPATRIIELSRPEGPGTPQVVFTLSPVQSGDHGNAAGLQMPNTQVMRQFQTAIFSQNETARITFDWPTGKRAVIAEVSHTSVVRSASPSGYGAWLSLYVFNDEGSGNAFNGAKQILLGDPKTGQLFVSEGKPTNLQCGDITVEYELSRFHWNRPARSGYSGNFDGEISLAVNMTTRTIPPQSNGIGHSVAREIRATKYCSQCGFAIPSDAKFCSNCGASVATSSSGRTSQAPDRLLAQARELMSRATRDSDWNAFRQVIDLSDRMLATNPANIDAREIRSQSMSALRDSLITMIIAPQPSKGCNLPLDWCWEFANDKSMTVESEYIRETDHFLTILVDDGVVIERRDISEGNWNQPFELTISPNTREVKLRVEHHHDGREWIYSTARLQPDIALGDIAQFSTTDFRVDLTKNGYPRDYWSSRESD